EARLMKRQPVITGLGIVSPIGVGVEKFWAAACAGQSGVGAPTLFDASKLHAQCRVVGEVRDFDPRKWMPGHAYRMAGRFSQFAVATATMARSDSRIQDTEIPTERFKVAIGTSMNGLTDVHQPNFQGFINGRDIQSWASIEFPAHAATNHVATSSGVHGQTMTFATACIAGLEAIAHAMIEALTNSGLGPTDIDYICAHGNSMVDYDAAETAGIKRTFGSRAWSIPISSLKSMCGQALAASSAIQLVAACLVIRHGIVPPTINYQFPDPECDLDYVPNVARKVRVRNVLVHAQ